MQSVRNISDVFYFFRVYLTCFSELLIVSFRERCFFPSDGDNVVVNKKWLIILFFKTSLKTIMIEYLTEKREREQGKNDKYVCGI